MFEYKIAEMKEEIRDLVNYIDSPQSLLDFNVGTLSKKCKNYLLMRTLRDDCSSIEFFVSKHAMFAVMGKLQGVDTRWASEFAS